MGSLTHNVQEGLLGRIAVAVGGLAEVVAGRASGDGTEHQGVTLADGFVVIFSPP